MRVSGLTKKAEPPPTRGSRKTKAAGDGGWLRRLVRCHGQSHLFCRLALDKVKAQYRYQVNQPMPIALAVNNRTERQRRGDGSRNLNGGHQRRENSPAEKALADVCGETR